MRRVRSEEGLRRVRSDGPLLEEQFDHGKKKVFSSEPILARFLDVSACAKILAEEKKIFFSWSNCSSVLVIQNSKISLENQGCVT